MIPVILIAYNRFTLLKNMVSYLETIPDTRIIILDNNSTYEPLKEYLRTIQHKVVFLKENLGNFSPWDCGLIKELKESKYIVSDSDLDLSEIPKDLVSVLSDGLDSYKNFYKVGLGLKISDIPDNPLKQIIVRKEMSQRFETVSSRFFISMLDTTFAIYRKNSNPFGYKNTFYNALRTTSPYEAKHVPWYTNLNKVDSEEKYYLEHANPKYCVFSNKTKLELGMITKENIKNAYKEIQIERPLRDNMLIV